MRHNYKVALKNSILEHQKIIGSLISVMKKGLYVNNPSTEYLNIWKDEMKSAIAKAEGR